MELGGGARAQDWERRYQLGSMKPGGKACRDWGPVLQGGQAQEAWGGSEMAQRYSACLASLTEFMPWNLYKGGRREQTTKSCILTSVYPPWHVHTQTTISHMLANNRPSNQEETCGVTKQRRTLLKHDCSGGWEKRPWGHQGLQTPFLWPLRTHTTKPQE